MSKLSVYFAHKNLFFLFYISIFTNTYISLSILHIYSIKYSFFYKFFIISSLTTLLSHRLNTTKKYKNIKCTSYYQKMLNARVSVTVHMYIYARLL